MTDVPVSVDVAAMIPGGVERRRAFTPMAAAGTNNKLPVLCSAMRPRKAPADAGLPEASGAILNRSRYCAGVPSMVGSQVEKLIKLLVGWKDDQLFAAESDIVRAMLDAAVAAVPELKPERAESTCPVLVLWLPA